MRRSGDGDDQGGSAREQRPPAPVHGTDVSSPVRAVRVLDETQRLLVAGGSFDEIVQLAPALLLRVIPAACRAELRLTRRGRGFWSAAETHPGRT